MTNINSTRYRNPQITDRQTAELIGLARGVIADGELTDGEIEYVHKWLVACEGIVGNPLISTLLKRIDEVLSDGRIDEDERADLMDALCAFTGNEFEVGEALKSTTLPLCAPVPEIRFDTGPFCFTGTFSYGKRTACETAVTERGGLCGTLTRKTAFLVIGEYATDSWAHSSYGRKIEKAVSLRTDGTGISIIHEPDWRAAL